MGSKVITRNNSLSVEERQGYRGMMKCVPVSIVIICLHNNTCRAGCIHIQYICITSHTSIVYIYTCRCVVASCSPLNMSSRWSQLSTLPLAWLRQREREEERNPRGPTLSLWRRAENCVLESGIFQVEQPHRLRYICTLYFSANL